MNKAILEALGKPTTTVAIAGEALGLSRNKAYQAAAEGQIPTLRFGKRIVVPTMPLKRMLGLGTDETAENPARAKAVE
jgi:hypothetical protein